MGVSGHHPNGTFVLAAPPGFLETIWAKHWSPLARIVTRAWMLPQCESRRIGSGGGTATAHTEGAPPCMLPPSASTSTRARSPRRRSTPSPRRSRAQGVRAGGRPHRGVGEGFESPVRLRVRPFRSWHLARELGALGVDCAVARGVEDAQAAADRGREERQERRRLPRPHARLPQRRGGLRAARGGRGDLSRALDDARDDLRGRARGSRSSC